VDQQLMPLPAQQKRLLGFAPLLENGAKLRSLSWWRELRLQDTNINPTRNVVAHEMWQRAQDNTIYLHSDKRDFLQLKQTTHGSSDCSTQADATLAVKGSSTMLVSF